MQNTTRSSIYYYVVSLYKYLLVLRKLSLFFSMDTFTIIYLSTCNQKHNKLAFWKMFYLNSLRINILHLMVFIYNVFIIINIYYKAETRFWVSVCLCTCSHSNKEIYSFENWYRDIREGFWRDLEVIFSKIDLDF